MPTDQLPVEGAGALGKYPHLFPPPGFITFDRNALFSVVPIGVETTLTSINITSLYDGWVRQIGLEASDWSVVYFTIYQGNAPMRDYTRIEVPLGSPTTPKSIFIQLLPNVALQLRCTASGPVSVRYNLFGWYYPAQGRS